MKPIHWIASVFATIALALTLATIWVAEGTKAWDLPDKLGATAAVFFGVALLLGLLGVE